ncbi:MAG TPA: VCBS repeat-containing protein [Armatimonadota bacterium]|nr:VCBS repeat-containing protein [Armatimonadota bacterium]
MRWCALVLLTALAGMASSQPPPADDLAAVGSSRLAWLHGREVRWLRVDAATATPVATTSLPERAFALAPVAMGGASAVTAAGRQRVYVLGRDAPRLSAEISLTPEVVVDLCSDDLDGDGWDELLVLAGEHGSRRATLRIYSVRYRRWLWRGLRPALHPWKVRAGDVDGDDAPDIVVGVWKQTRFDPVWDHRAFVYHWADGDLHPSWLGSRLGRRFSDFELADTDGDGQAEIVTIARMDNGWRLSGWQRYGFGFQEVWTGRTSADIAAVSAAGRPATLFALERDNGWQVRAHRPAKESLGVVTLMRVATRPAALCALDGDRAAVVSNGQLQILSVAQGGVR